MKKRLLFLIFSFLLVFPLIVMGVVLNNSILKTVAIIWAFITLFSFIIILMIVPSMEAKKAFQKFSQKIGIPIIEKPDKNLLPNVFHHINPYPTILNPKEEIEVFQKVENMIKISEDFLIFSNTQGLLMGSHGNAQTQKHLCFIFKIEIIPGYHHISLDDRPYANVLMGKMTNILGNLMNTKINLVKTNIPEIDEVFRFSSDNPEELQKTVLIIKDNLFEIKNLFSKVSSPQYYIDYWLSKIKIEMNQGFVLARVSFDYAKFIDQIYPMLTEIKNKLS